MTSLADGLAFTLWVGAANADATPEQRRRIQDSIPIALEHYVVDGDEMPVRTIIQIVMGPDWKPTGEWADFIASLTP
jgi:hypothetical protein